MSKPQYAYKADSATASFLKQLNTAVKIPHLLCLMKMMFSFNLWIHLKQAQIEEIEVNQTTVELT